MSTERAAGKLARRNQSRQRVLLEMRPALDGHAGIPQETRLLFRNLCGIATIDVFGLMQTSLRFLTRGAKRINEAANADPEVQSAHRREAGVLASFAPPVSRQPLAGELRYLRRHGTAFLLGLLGGLFRMRVRLRTTWFDVSAFGNEVWCLMFDRTLPRSDYAMVTGRNHLVCTVPWNVMQMAGLKSRVYGRGACYPELDTRGIDVFIVQTPYPGRVSSGTSLVVRYHDALPLVMPEMFAHKHKHRDEHYYALASNIGSGAYFACVSETTRRELVRLFPEVGPRTVTIYNMVSHHYFLEDSSVDAVADIVRRRTNLSVHFAPPELPPGWAPEPLLTDASAGAFVLMVSTVEPRKNHKLLAAALSKLKERYSPNLKWIVVGKLGWDAAPIVAAMRPLVEAGCLFALENVQADELRVLYRHAAVTVCPSIAEGFDYSGVEAMRSGGAVLASDIEVHREIFGNAAIYFANDSASDLAEQLELMLTGKAAILRSSLQERGASVSARYLPEAVLPEWRKFLASIQ